jgi:signal transduction histidine kinase
MTAFPARRVRATQIGLLILLLVCSAQLAYWLIDEVRYTADVKERLRTAYEAEVESARALVRAGTPWAGIAYAYPQVTLAADSASLRLDPRVVERLESERHHRLNRYAWEGAFFLAVLVASMAIVYHAVREDAELRRRQEEFLAAVSHELKSPLASLRLSAETLALRDPPAARRAELVQRLLGDLGRLQRVISNLLETSRLSAAALRGAPQRAVLAEAVADVVGELRDQEEGSTARLHVEVPDDLEIVADPEGLRTVLRNLVHNAVKATSGGGDITVRASAVHGGVRLEVSDTGIGFPPDESPRLFEKFYRVAGDPGVRPSGTGLGLFLVRRFAELDGATVTAQSAGAGRGARFTVTWPTAGRTA